MLKEHNDKNLIILKQLFFTIVLLEEKYDYEFNLEQI